MDPDFQGDVLAVLCPSLNLFRLIAICWWGLVRIFSHDFVITSDRLPPSSDHAMPTGRSIYFEISWTERNQSRCRRGLWPSSDPHCRCSEKRTISVGCQSAYKNHIFWSPFFSLACSVLGYQRLSELSTGSIGLWWRWRKSLASNIIFMELEFHNVANGDRMWRLRWVWNGFLVYWQQMRRKKKKMKLYRVI